MQLGFNEAGMFKSSSILTYYSTEQTICTRMNDLILWLIKKGENTKFERTLKISYWQFGSFLLQMCREMPHYNEKYNAMEVI